ncbi:hypothetical protein AGOR_G00194920 [Albula goreensis]|uniref:Uncharacterized protein n=1 Tax=Albula goreensis TaxID=1534307 RepID=A0A8T3CW34_9TELE|nr:hypothetical protein AGOR_G00194920 [Albula goreensis]
MWGIFSICVLSIAGVTASSAQPVELQGIMGQTVTFTTAVRNMGTFSYSGTGIGDVTNGEFTASPNEQFTGRLQWDSSTGFFSITGLKMEDKGEYKVEDTQGKVEKLYKLTVYSK